VENYSIVGQTADDIVACEHEMLDT
jgi:hypothetical protein